MSRTPKQTVENGSGAGLFYAYPEYCNTHGIDDNQIRKLATTIGEITGGVYFLLTARDGDCLKYIGVTERTGGFHKQTGQKSCIGGKMEAGESALDALDREGDEEAGLKRGFIKKHQEQVHDTQLKLFYLFEGDEEESGKAFLATVHYLGVPLKELNFWLKAKQTNEISNATLESFELILADIKEILRHGNDEYFLDRVAKKFRPGFLEILTHILTNMDEYSDQGFKFSTSCKPRQLYLQVEKGKYKMTHKNSLFQLTCQLAQYLEDLLITMC